MRALSWREVDEVRERFSTLDLPLNLTRENFPDGFRRLLQAFAVAGSRVILYRELPGGRRLVVKRSAVALGDGAVRSTQGQVEGSSTKRLRGCSTSCWAAQLSRGPGSRSVPRRIFP